MHLRRSASPLLLFLLLLGCAGGMRPAGGAPGAPAPPAAVERFLQLASERDYVGMGWVFGTDEGSVLERDPTSQVEQRMYAIASILQHDGFIVGNGTPVPGRVGEALLFDVIMTRGTVTYRVPFTTIRGPGGRWFVEQVDVEAITES